MTKNKITNADVGNYASVNGLKMYYEIHGTGKPLVLLHGALSGIDIDFGKVIPYFARTRQVIALEQQAHGHTADINRPLSIEQMVDDTVSLLHHVGIENADIFGYSMGAGIALQIAVKHPNMVRKLVVASLAYNKDGFHPELLAGIGNLKPGDLAGSPFQKAYERIAPNPDDWSILISKMNRLNQQIPDWMPETVQSMRAPTQIIIGDSDIVRPEHAVEMFRLLGGGVIGDIMGLPRSQLAILPGTTHITLVERADWLSSMIMGFLKID